MAQGLEACAFCANRIMEGALSSPPFTMGSANRVKLIKKSVRGDLYRLNRRSHGTRPQSWRRHSYGVKTISAGSGSSTNSIQAPWMAGKRFPQVKCSPRGLSSYHPMIYGFARA